MNDLDMYFIKKTVEENLSPKRYQHVVGVIETARELALMHKEPFTGALLAALTHDVLKELPLEESKQMLIKYGEESYLDYSSKVWHAPLGAIYAKEKFNITHCDVLNAVRYHTTGRSNMSLLEKIIFVADYTEPNRKFEGAEVVRKLWNDIDKAVYEILKQKIEKVKANGLGMHPDTISAYEYYKSVVNAEDL